MKKADIIAGILGLALSVYVAWAAAQFPEDKVLLLGPHFFPTLLAIGLGLMSLILIAKAMLGKAKKAGETFDLKDPGIQRAGIALLATILYGILLPHVGFIIMSIVYLFFLMCLLKQRNYSKMLAIALGVTFIVYGIFRVALNITLPTGFLG
ncbi:MAG: hypothetical protein JG781_2475 [Peptococcaceae bacterium]|nr:hypothetical protein [Peptococcaceae bacterium]